MNDFRLFDMYRRENTQTNHNGDYCDIDHLLRFWRESKGEYLAPLFGDKLILERPIEYNRSQDELGRSMEEMIAEQRFVIDELMSALKKAAGVYDIYEENTQAYIVRYMNDVLCRTYSLIENVVHVEHIWYYMDRWADHSNKPKSIQLKLGDKIINVQEGQKVTRLWGQIAKVLNMSDTWEKFRIAHSQCLNQKRLKGTLCLSIHPLDYATASDNDNGWSSCMSWRENGCYRMGTVEMMNSPMVICAYLRSDKQHMEIDGEQWNSKKWRAWIIVNKYAIICNRHYPYHQDEFAKEAIAWVRDLVTQKYGWEYEDEIHTDFYDYMREIDCEIEYRTNYMYNDLGGEDVVGCMNKKHRNPGYINFSGKAECMVCGDEIPVEVQGADQLECLGCWSEYHCDECGCELSEDDVCYGPNGEVMCCDCYNEQCCQCTECDSTIWRDDSINIQFPIYQNRARKFYATASRDFQQRFTSWNGRVRFPATEGEEVCLCSDCASRFHLAEVDYDTKSDEVNVDYTLTVFDPNHIDIEKAFDVIQPDGWNWSRSGYNRRNHAVEAEELRNFWTDQWEAFKEDFNNCPETDDD